jgi:hypothetical protein
MDRRGSSFSASGEPGDAWRPEPGWTVPGLGVPEAVVEPDPVSRFSPEEAWRLLPAVLAGMAGTQWWRLSEAEVTARAGLLGRSENQVVATQVAAVGEAVQRGMHTRAGHKTGGAWLRGIVPLTPHAAHQRGALAQELPATELALTRQAFQSGAIAAGHAAAITRTMADLDRVPDIEPATWADAQGLLVEEARRVDPAQLGKAAAHLRTRLDPHGPERLARDEDLQHEQRAATLVQESSGMWFLTAALPRVEGAKLALALDVLGEPRPGQDGTPDPRSRAQRTADGLTSLADLSLAKRPGEIGGLPSRHGSPVRLVVTADLQTLTADVTRRGGQAGVPAGVLETGQPGGTEVSPLEVQMLACDAETIPALRDGDSRLLDIGESAYRFPLRIRRAIEYRDKHCSFPNCQAPPNWCHTHHLVPFGRGGRPGGSTSEANGTLLCGRHHRHVHANGWVGSLVDGHVRWRPPRPGAPPLEATDHARRFETKLRQLALRWLSRNPQLRDTGG